MPEWLNIMLTVYAVATATIALIAALHPLGEYDTRGYPSTSCGGGEEKA